MYKYASASISPLLAGSEYYIRTAAGQDLAIWKLDEQKTTWYVFGSSRLAHIETDEDGSLPTATTFYNYDHLGNTRLSYNATPSCNGAPLYTATAAFDYYPYGKVLREFGASTYLTTGNERDAESGLDFRNARYYDNEIGRFGSTDAHGGRYAAWSTYSYCFGNTLSIIDPSGMDGNPAVFVDGQRMNDQESEYWLGRAEKFVEAQNRHLRSYDFSYGRRGNEFGSWAQWGGIYQGNATRFAKFVPSAFGGGGNALFGIKRMFQAPNQSKTATAENDADNESGLKFSHIGFGASVCAVAAIGLSIGVDCNWIVSGPNASFKPVVSFTMGGPLIGLAGGIDGHINVGWTSAPAKKLTAENMFETPWELWNGQTYSAAFGVIGASYSNSKLNDSYRIHQLSLGSGAETPLPKIGGYGGGYFSGIIKQF
jgi:RHS repeat-associated protein